MKWKFRSRYLREFIEEIQFKNRNPRDIKALELLDDLSTNPERLLVSGTELFRCRIIDDQSQINKEPGFFGYGAKESFVPPPKNTKDLRANYRYIPYLYCATHPYMALVETRPRLGAHVSIATILTNQPIRLLDFTMNKTSSRMTDAKKNLFSDLSALFSKPVTSDDDILDYIPTQYIAEYAKNLGYDGIAFESSLMPELSEEWSRKRWGWDRYNIVVFNYQKCAPVKSNEIKVTRNYIECCQIDKDIDKVDRQSTIEEIVNELDGSVHTLVAGVS